MFVRLRHNGGVVKAYSLIALRRSDNIGEPAGTKLELFLEDLRRLNQIIKSEMERIKNDPDLRHLVQEG